MARKSKAKIRSYAGLSQRNFPRSVSWAVDQDYVTQLSPELRQWLARFNDNHYGAKFDDSDTEWDRDKRRASYRAKNYANHDAYAPAQAGNAIAFIDEAPGGYASVAVTVEEREWSEPPAYLESPEYRAALIAFRDASDKRKQDPEGFRVAQRRLEEIVRESK